MLIIYADREGPVIQNGNLFYPDCPLRSDLNTCNAVEMSEINSCPILDDEGEYYSYPNFCPLKQGDIIVRIKGE